MEAKGKCIMIKSLGFELELIIVGLHRSSFGPGLNGQPAPIFKAKFRGVAPANKGTRRITTIKIRILDFMTCTQILCFYLLS